jgi:hypothetical protein
MDGAGSMDKHQGDNDYLNFQSCNQGYEVFKTLSLFKIYRLCKK